MLSCFKNINSIGILGGTFNPIHNGHINILKKAMEQYKNIDSFVLLPNNLPAYKDSFSIVDSKHRINMLKLVAEHMDNVLVSDIEIKRGGVTYTYDTLCEIKKANPEIEIYFIIGSDSLMSITKWYRYKEVLKLCHLLVARREQDYDIIKNQIALLKSENEDISIDCIDTEFYVASSSAIRNDISNSLMPKELMPDYIVSYIEKNNLYGWK